MKHRTLYIFIALAFILQPLCNAMLPWWITPKLGLCLLMVLGLMEDVEELTVPLAWIFGLSLIVDATSIQYVGTTVISMVAVLVFILLLKRMGNVENLVFSLLVITGSMVIYNVVYWAVYAAFGAPYGFLHMALRIPGESLSTIAVTLAAVFVISRDLVQQRRDKYFR